MPGMDNLRFLKALALLNVLVAASAAPRGRPRDDVGSRDLGPSKRGRITVGSWPNRSRPTPANTFRLEVQRTTEGVLRTSRRLIGGHNQDTAVMIHNVLTSLRDPDQNIQDFRVSYSIAVWDRAIRPDFEDFVHPDRTRASVPLSLFSTDGLTVNLKCCDKFQAKWGEGIGVFGWPCPSGGAAVAQAGTSAADQKNSIVIFQTSNQAESLNWQSKLTILSLASYKCLEEELNRRDTATGSGALLYLTNLSECTYNNIYDRSFVIAELRGRYLPCVFSCMKGVIAIPSFVADSSAFGWLSNAGGVFVINLQVNGGLQLTIIGYGTLSRCA